MSNPWVHCAALQESVEIEPVLAHYRVRLKRVRADYLRGLCPLPTHGSAQSRESFGVNTRRGVWACHSASCCQARPGRMGGNILELVASMEVCSMREAALRLQAWMGAPGDSRFSDQLVSKERRVNREQEESPRLSFTLRWQWHPYWAQRGIHRLTADRFGAGYYGGSGFLRGRLVFPIHNARGELVAYAGRSLDGHEPRYLFPPGFRKSQVVFNLHRAVEVAARLGGVAIVVEGFFDCLKVDQAGYGKVVALMGAHVSERQCELLDHCFRELVVLLDGDETGRRASQKLAARRWKNVALSLGEVPSGRQPDPLSSEEIGGILSRANAALGA